MKNKIYLDMDGTIADLYNVENWLRQIKEERVGLFSQLRPLVCESELLKIFPKENYQLVILTMTPKDSSQEYRARVIEEKDEWLDNFFPAIQERIYLDYGHDKNLVDSENSILIDDNVLIRQKWKGIAIDPTELW